MIGVRRPHRGPIQRERGQTRRRGLAQETGRAVQGKLHASVIHL